MSAPQLNAPALVLSSLQVLIRNHRGALKKLFKSRTQWDKNYWAKACEHWDSEITKVIGNANMLPSGKDMIEQLRHNIRSLSPVVDHLVVDDLLYRLDAIIETIANDTHQKQTLKNEKDI